MRRNTIKTISLILVMALVLGFASVASAAYTMYATEDVTVRSGPGSSYTKIGSLSEGNSVIATGNSVNGWTQVKLSEHEQGYVESEHLSFYWPVSGSTTSRPYYGSNVSVSGNTAPIYGRAYLAVDRNYGDTYYATANLNVRSGPGTNYSVIGSLSRNQQVTRIGKDGNWYKLLTSNGQSAYASASYLKKLESGTATSSGNTAVSYGTYYTTTGLNVRKGPGTGYSVIDTLSRGAAVTYLGERDGDWYKVRTSSGLVGYCHSAYLSSSASSSSSGSSCIPRVQCGYCGRYYYGTVCTYCQNGKYWYNWNYNYTRPYPYGWVTDGCNVYNPGVYVGQYYTLARAEGNIPAGGVVVITGMSRGSDTVTVKGAYGSYNGITATTKISNLW